MSVEILGSENVKQGNLLLDSGAQVILIRLSLAEELGLKGKDATITLAKVGGEEDEWTTKLFRVRIRSANRRDIHTVMAVGIPCISSDVTECKLSHLAGLFGLREEEIHRKNGPVELLIGIDHPKLHMGETREAANLIARQSPIGWVVFGATPGKHAQVSRIFNVKVPTPVDVTDFWTPETMGVAAREAEKLSPVECREAKIIEESCQKIGNQWLIPYPWKRDPKELPDKEAQAKKKLETTERRLSKTPEHAAAYDGQIMEMADMKFSRKLAKQELRTYKGPVHYIVDFKSRDGFRTDLSRTKLPNKRNPKLNHCKAQHKRKY